MSTETINSLTKKNSRRGVLTWLIVSQVLALVSLLPWLAIAGLSFMAFDGGVTTEAEIFVGVILSYPVVVLVCALLAWLMYRLHKDRWALVITSLFLLGPIIFFVFIFISPMLNF